MSSSLTNDILSVHHASCVTQRDSRRIGLWRSARERAVWLLDLAGVARTGSVAAAAYAAVVLRDRCTQAFDIFVMGSFKP